MAPIERSTDTKPVMVDDFGNVIHDMRDIEYVVEGHKTLIKAKGAPVPAPVVTPKSEPEPVDNDPARFLRPV